MRCKPGKLEGSWKPSSSSLTMVWDEPERKWVESCENPMRKKVVESLKLQVMTHQGYGLKGTGTRRDHQPK